MRFLARAAVLLGLSASAAPLPERGLASAGRSDRDSARAADLDRRPAKLLRVFVDRAHGHSGSRWFASMLGAANFSTHFQFGGLCAASSTELLGAARRAEMLQDLLRHGCACGAGVTVMTADSTKRCRRVDDGGATVGVRGCNGNAWCKDRCAARRGAEGCRGVVAITGHQPAPASGAAVFMWLRYNSVKSALSRFKGSCNAPGFRYGGENERRAVVQFADPGMLLAHAAKALRSRRRGEERGGHRLYYEDFQRDPTGALAAVFEVLHVEASVAAVATRTFLAVKLTPERLADIVLDFAAVNRTFAGHCLQAQLLAEAPLAFDLCPARHGEHHAAATPRAKDHVCDDKSTACEAARVELGEAADVCVLS